MALDFLILGPLEVRSEGVVVSLRGRRQRALLALLLLHANEVVSVDALAEGLWGGRPPRTPSRSLQVFVSDLRKGLRGADATTDRIVTQPPGYRIDVAAGELDLERFERLAAEGRAALARGEAAVAASALRDALAIWRGEALADFTYEPFAQAAMGRLEELRLTAVEERVAADLQLGRHAELVGELEALVAQHPYRERLRAHLMLALYRAGRQSEALAVYQATRTLLVEELGIDPKPELQELERAILVQDPALELPIVHPKPRVAGERSGLPTPPTRLVGRERELAELEELVLAERLVTVTGPGGIGKTRIALAACERLHPRFDDGARFLQLAPLADPALLPATIALALEVEERPGEELVDTLGHALEERELLVCLDNLEHLLDATTFLGDLLSRCPRLSLLVTSRSVLRLAAEREYPLPPLRGEEAVLLFEERARGAYPRFTLQGHEATVLSICDRLDRLPLALELAAARVRLLPPPALLARLERALPLLGGGPRDRPERQQTLRAAIEWSYQLLDPAEQRLFRALSVFAGGFTLEAAVAVSGEDELALLDPLGALIEHNLVRRAADDDGEARFLLLQTIREYAADQLEETREAGEARRRHAEYYVHFAAPGAPLEFFTDEVAAWLPEAERERANLRSALAWLVDQEDTDRAAELGVALSTLWCQRGPLGEGSEWLDRILAAPAVEPKLRANALRGAGAIAMRQGRHGRARELLSESLQLWRSLGARAEMQRALNSLGGIAVDQGDPAGGPILEEALALARELGDKPGTGVTLLNLGVLARSAGDYARARRYYEESLQVHQELDSAFGVALAMGQLGSVAVEEGNHSEAEQQIRAALETIPNLGANDYVIEILEWFAALDARRGEANRAAIVMAALERQREELGLTVPGCDQASVENTAALIRSHLDPSELAAAGERGRTLSFEEIVALARDGG